MKIGILTQPLRTNYGGILQNYALQQVLKGLGHSPVTLDYTTYYSPVRWILGKVKAFVSRTEHDIDFPTYFRAGQGNLNEFVHRHIRTTRPYKNLPLRKFARTIDCLIVGSDQVWRPGCNAPVELMYEMYGGSIVDIDIPKIAYAASFGSDKWEYTAEQTERCSQLVTGFKAVSTREKSGVELCREHLKVDAMWVLDPTLLLKGEDYVPLFDSIRPYNKPTLFAYILDTSKEKIRIIEDIAAKRGLEVFIKGANDDICHEDSLEQWLAWIKNAEMVVTDSFHGMVFSIQFHRPFKVFGDSWRGNARFTSLLGLTGLSGKEDEEIDWDVVEKRLGDAREKSIEYLRKNL